MPEIAPYTSACLRISALVPQGAYPADFGLALILKCLTILIVSRPFQPLSSGAKVNIFFGIIGKCLIRKHSVAVLAVFERRNMSL